MNDIRESDELVIGQVANEADFKEKFPFNLEKEPEPVVYSQPVMPVVKVEERKSMDDLVREKYEQDLKQL